MRALRWLQNVLKESRGAALAAATLGAACATTHPVHQAADDGWTPTVAQPTFPGGQGPVVLVDAGHGNWHTIDGRFAPFAELLSLDGYRLEGAPGPITAEALQSTDIFVIANPVLGGEESVWVLPTPPAFTNAEVAALEAWVADGGALLLIADHMPFGGSAEDLAAAFGITFYNGYAKPAADRDGSFTFTREAGTLADHPVTRGRTTDEAVAFVRTFNGQAFRVEPPAETLMMLPEDWSVWLPSNADVVGLDTPRISARGLAQGAVLSHGAGRVAVFGEAAMFTAQSVPTEQGVIRVGLNAPAAERNAQFVLNVMRWLAETRPE